VPVQAILAADMTASAQAYVSRNPAMMVNRALPAFGHLGQVNSRENSAQRIGQSPLAPLAVAITATKRDALLVDGDGDTRTDPGDALHYSIVIRNSGSDDATGVVFTDTIDNNTTLSGTLKSTPLARNDAYSAVGNVRISVPAGSGVLANDNDPDGGAISVVSASTTSVNGGNVAVNGTAVLPTIHRRAIPEQIRSYIIQDADATRIRQRCR
jgi:uncharacterized repeat protein (TIGR01451 family)